MDLPMPLSFRVTSEISRLWTLLMIVVRTDYTAMAQLYNVLNNGWMERHVTHTKSQFPLYPSSYI